MMLPFRLARPILAAAALVSADAGAQACAAPGRDGDGALVGVVNTYWTPSASGSYGPSTTSIAMTNQGGAVASLVEGDLMLVMQMQCADINPANSLAYGDGIAGEPASGYTDPTACRAGTYEFFRAGAGSSNGVLSLVGSPLVNTYVQADATATAGRRTVQIIRVPQYANATLSGTVTALPWNGINGGVVALDVAQTLDLNNQIFDADGAGFRGGGGRSRAVADTVERFRWDTDTRHAVKGEGIAGTPRFVSSKRTVDDGAVGTVTDLGATWGGYPTGTASTGDFARGAPGNAGGGGAYWDGSSDNGGGGGGGNGNSGGRGGAGWRSAGYAGVLADYSNLTDKKWGFGGASFAGASLSRLVLGGGGGAGENNANSVAAASNGGAGGGIVMVRAETLTGTGIIRARGARATDNVLNDGAGGGGAGGSVLVVATNWSASLSVDVSGGRGGDAWVPGTSAHGNGGGGSGGVVFTSAPASTVVAGGAPGVTNTVQGQPGGAAHGAQTGSGGVSQVVQAADDIVGASVGRTCKSDLRLTKTNTPGIDGDVDQAADTVVAGSTTVYALTVRNNGPKPADGAVLRDTPTSGLDCISATCAAIGGAACPVETGAALATAVISSGGVAIPTLPVGGAITVNLSCTVLAN